MIASAISVCFCLDHYQYSQYVKRHMSKYRLKLCEDSQVGSITSLYLGEWLCSQIGYQQCVRLERGSQCIILKGNETCKKIHDVTVVTE